LINAPEAELQERFPFAQDFWVGAITFHEHENNHSQDDQTKTTAEVVSPIHCYKACGKSAYQPNNRIKIISRVVPIVFS